MPIASGDRNGARTHPERLARGDRHGSQTHPECVPNGEQHWNSKLNADIVREIRILRGFGFSFEELGKRYGVARTGIHKIVAGETWKHVI